MKDKEFNVADLIKEEFQPKTQSVIDDEMRLRLIKRAISSTEGWRALAQSIKNQPDFDLAKTKCLDFFDKIAGEKLVTIPVTPLKDGEAGQESSDEEVKMMEIKLFDLLSNQLDKYLAEV